MGLLLKRSFLHLDSKVNFEYSCKDYVFFHRVTLVSTFSKLAKRFSGTTELHPQCQSENQRKNLKPRNYKGWCQVQQLIQNKAKNSTHCKPLNPLHRISLLHCSDDYIRLQLPMRGPLLLWEQMNQTISKLFSAFKAIAHFTNDM